MTLFESPRQKQGTLRNRLATASVAASAFKSDPLWAKVDRSSPESFVEDWQYTDQDPVFLVFETPASATTAVHGDDAAGRAGGSDSNRPASEEKNGALCALFLTVALLIYVALVLAPQSQSSAVTSISNDDEGLLVLQKRSTRLGLATASTVFLIYCMVYGRDQSSRHSDASRRLRSGVGSIVHGMGLLYFMFLCFLTAKDIHSARGTLSLFDPSLGPMPIDNFREYASDCRLYASDNARGPYENIFEALFDVFTVAHILGWIAKGVIIRDYPLLWAWSLGWEVMEITFQFLLPNFKECWWDHWVLDMLVCNFPGMVLGLWICARLDVPRYSWMSTGRSKSKTSQAGGVWPYFSMFSSELYSWDVFTSPTRLFQVLLLLIFMLLAELNAFFLKFVLYVPPPSMLNVVRLLLLAALSTPAVGEYYEYIQARKDQDKHRGIGSNLWLMSAIVSTELALVLKFSFEDPSQYSAKSVLGEELAAKVIRPQMPQPRIILSAWILSVTMFGVGYALFLFVVASKSESNPGAKPANQKATAKPRSSSYACTRILSLILLWSSPVPLMYLVVVDFKDTFHF